MHKALVISASCVMAAAFSVSAADVVSVALRKEVSVADGPVTLGDVADVKGGASPVRQLEAIRLGVAPRMGESITMKRASIEQAIRAAVAGREQAIEVAGQAVTVRGKGVRFERERLIAVAEAHLRQALAAEQVRLELAPVGIIEDLYHPGGQVEVKSGTRGKIRMAARVPVWLDVVVDGKWRKTLPVWFAVHAYKPVLVARRSLPARTMVSADDLVAEERDVARLAGKPAATGALARDGWLRRAVVQGAVLTEGDITAVPAVKRKESVKVTVARGPIRVETIGVAAADGHVGDIIPVEKINGAKGYLARVTADGAVQVDGDVQ